jgi:hypothetical protein
MRTGRTGVTVLALGAVLALLDGAAVHAAEADTFEVGFRPLGALHGAWDRYSAGGPSPTSAPDHGFYGFRNRWAGDHGFVLLAGHRTVPYGMAPHGSAETAKESNMTAGKPLAGGETLTWNVDNTNRIAGLPVTRVGQPRVENTGIGPAVWFDGGNDGLVLSTNPVQDAAAFTVETLFRPDPGGAVEQRFFHIQEDGTATRVLLELRQPSGGQWYADTFIQTGSNNCVLNDPKRLHAAGQWHTLALVCDGTRMFQYVDGVKELEGKVAYAPMKAGSTSIGMRINRVHWFKGAIRLVRISPRALAADELLKP